MIVLGLDPGTEQSALVAFNGESVRDHRTLPNRELLMLLREIREAEIHSGNAYVLVIEQIESFGMAVGKETFETVFWTGRFAEAWCPKRFERLPRRPIKIHLCQSARATDANIRQALIDRFGPTSEKAIGRKASPGPLYGLRGHEVAALAVAVTWYDLNGHLPQELRPGIRPEF